jgi:NADPH:quinone reductase-like Zn-dependent oxidoreductase
VQPGQTVLVHAAGSGVSSLAIQIAKLRGARVIATAGSDEKVARARSLGADHAINYKTQDFLTETKSLTGKAGVDVVIDHVGGEVLEKSVLATAWGGKIVTCGATSGFHPKIDLRHIFFRQIALLGSTMGSKADLLAAMPHVRAGRIRPVVDRAMSLWDAKAAHELLESRSVFGKIVLTI